MTANNSNTNIRMPELMLPGEYPYVRSTQFRDGSWERTDESPNNESQALGHKLGSFEETDNSSGHKHLKVGQSFEYAAQGHTTTVDYNSHNKIGGSTVSQVSQDHHEEHGGDKWHAVYGDSIHAVKGLHYTHGTGGISHTSVGDKVTDHNDGNDHHNIQGDHVVFVGGVRYENVNSEYGVYIGGNYDVMANGKFQITTKQNYQLNATVNGNISTPNLYANVTWFIIDNSTDTSNLMIGSSQQNTIINSSAIDVGTVYAGSIMMGDPVEFVNTSVLNIGNLIVSANSSNGLSGQVLTTNSSGVYWEYTHSQPAGNDQWIQFNQANSLAAVSQLRFDYNNNNLIISNGVFSSEINSNSLYINYILLNGSQGNVGELLTSGGSGNSVYWSNTTSYTSNNTNYVGSVSASNVVSNAQLIANLANYQTTAGLSGNVATLTSNNTNYLGGSYYTNYATYASLPSQVSSLTSNNSTYLNGKPSSYYANVTSYTGAFNGTTITASGNANFSDGLFAGLGSYGQLQLTYGNYGVIHRNDGGSYYILVTANGSPNGVWASYFPFVIGLAGGGVLMNEGVNIKKGLTSDSITAGSYNSGNFNTIIAYANNTAGIASYSNSGIGVYGQSNTYWGGYFESTSGDIVGFANNTTLLSYINNSGEFVGTANNALYLNGLIASGYQTTAGLTANIAAYLPIYTGVINASSISTSSDVTIGGSLTITGNLTLAGQTTFVNSTVITTSDHNIYLANGASTNSLANNAGLIIGSSANLIYNALFPAWQSNVDFIPFSNNLNLGTINNQWNIYSNNINGENISLAGSTVTVNSTAVTGFIIDLGTW